MTVSLAITVAGTTLSVGSAPASYDSAGFGAVSYTAVAEVTNIGSFGKKYNVVSHMSLSNRIVVKRKGSANSGQLQLKMARTSDAGQAALLAASNSDASFSFKIVLPSGKIEYFTGQVTSFVLDVGSIDSILSASVDIELDNDIIEV